MPFIPHTEADIQQMLGAIGIGQVADLFLEMPGAVPAADFSHWPDGMNEREITQHFASLAALQPRLKLFIGAGAYQHFIPAAVWQLLSRGEWLTAYTPYQPEASQGSLQLIYEFQSMMTRLLAMEVSNASLYDGASALVEAVLMAVRLQRGKRMQVLVPQNLHPHYLQVLATCCRGQNIELLDLPYAADGKICQRALAEYLKNPASIAACIIAQPNFFGGLEQVDALTNTVQQAGVMVIAQVNPLAMAWLKPPGQWGEHGATLACGEAQPLGMPLSMGGPYAGFLCCRQSDVRQLPGRLVGKTEDQQGQVGYALTLQAREQHIRRAKAKSNICTNQGLLVAAATIYMSLLGGLGLQEVAQLCHRRASALRAACLQLPGVEAVFSGDFFHEFVLRLPMVATDFIKAMQQQGIVAGYALDTDTHDILLCATDMTTMQDIEQYAVHASKILKNIKK